MCDRSGRGKPMESERHHPLQCILPPHILEISSATLVPHSVRGRWKTCIRPVSFAARDNCRKPSGA